MTYRILVTDEINQAGLDLLGAAPDVELEVRLGLHGEALRQVIPGFDVVITRSGTALDTTFFNTGKGTLKIAARAGVGLDNVDIQAATLAASW